MSDFSFWVILSNLLLATRWTILLSLIAFVCGGIVGLILLFARVSGNPWLERLTRWYIEFFQGTPLLMQLFLFFFGLALFGIDVDPWIAAWLALTFWTTAFLTDIWRGCVEAIPKGQWEASDTLALSYIEQMRYVILPQAARIAIAPTVGFSVQVIKGTALASIIGFVDLTKAGTMLNNATFRPFLVYSLVALIYFALCFPLSWYAHRLERQLHVARSMSPAQTRVAGGYRGCAQELRPDRGAEGRIGRCRARRRGCDHRPFGFGQVDAAALHQRTGDLRFRRHRRRRHRCRPVGARKESCATCAATSAWCSSNSICSRI